MTIATGMRRRTFPLPVERGGTNADSPAGAAAELEFASLAAVQVFTGSTNQFVNVYATGGIQAAGNLGTDSDLVIDTLTVSPASLTDVRAQTWSDKDGEIPAASGTKDGTKFLRDDGTWQPVGGGSIPTGTGFRHVTAGVEDAASQLVAAADTTITGIPDGTKYLRDDWTWQAVTGGSGLTQPQVFARLSVGF